jgi:flagellar motor protein MotB
MRSTLLTTKTVTMMTTLCAALVAVGGLGGCARNRAKDRTKILSAEVIDLRQKDQMNRDQLNAVVSANDRTTATLQQRESELAQARKEAAQLPEAQQRAAAAEDAVAQWQAALAERDAALQRQQAEIARLARIEADRKRNESNATNASFKDSDQLQGLRRDVADRLAKAGVNAPVEIRTTRAGQRKVAVVLQDAFPAGKDSLASSPKTVEAVARLSQVIQATYPSSKIHIEGHTDADPISKSNWPSNEALGLARADTVKKLLVHSGLNDSQVETEGVGARNPIAKGSTPRAKSQNRRVEIYVSPR